MANIALLLDEDVRVKLGEILRQRGYDVLHVLEADRAGQDGHRTTCLRDQPATRNSHPQHS